MNEWMKKKIVNNDPNFYTKPVKRYVDKLYFIQEFSPSVYYNEALGPHKIFNYYFFNYENKVIILRL